MTAVDPAAMRDVLILGVIYQSVSLKPTKRYYINLGVRHTKSSDELCGIQKKRSEKRESRFTEVHWDHPFGDSFSIPSSLESGIIISVYRTHRIARDEVIGTCEVDLLTTSEAGVPVRSEKGAQIGLLFVTATVTDADARSHRAQAEAAGAALRGPAALQVSSPSAGTLGEEAVKQSDAWAIPLDVLLSRLKKLDTLVHVLDAVAEVHPWVKLAWGIVSVAYKVVKAQDELDQRMQDLIEVMSNSCDFVEDVTPLEGRFEKCGTVIKQTMQQIIQCSYFIRDYAKNTSFLTRTAKNALPRTSSADSQVQQYMSSFSELRKALLDQANIQCTIQVFRMVDIVDSMAKAVHDAHAFSVLREMQFTSKASPDLERGCLPGTRIEAIACLMRWATGAETVSSPETSTIGTWSNLKADSSSRVLWLCGVAGSGKSSIARSVAKRLKEIGRLGCIYAFDANHADTNPTNLFSTIARKLADLDPLRKQRLVEVVENDTDLRTTTLCRTQFEKFIVAPSTSLPTIGETIIIIDAFDESGDISTRAEALSILTKSAHLLPAGIRVMITSRLEPDVLAALQSPLSPGVDMLSMQDLPEQKTSRDISMYVREMLKGVLGLDEARRSGRLDTLARKAETSFQWAFTACEFIKGPGVAGVNRQKRLATVLESHTGLDALYTKIISQHFVLADEDSMSQFQTILGAIICAYEPLSLRSLSKLGISRDLDLLVQQETVQHLASLLNGTHDLDAPIFPFHPSFRDFLKDRKRSAGFCVYIPNANSSMAHGCLDVMKDGLRYNICEFPTSLKGNQDIPDLSDRIHANISIWLSYACRYWPTHVSELAALDRTLERKIERHLRCHFLYWLEVMSVLEQAPQTAMAHLSVLKTSSDLRAVILDASRFASVFSAPIAHSVPHIYMSALAFTPVSSVFQECLPYFPGLVGLIRGRFSHWPSLVRVLIGHDLSVCCVTISPNGRQIASGSTDGTVWLWDPRTGKRIGEPLSGHTHSVVSVAFSADGRQLVSGSFDKTVRLWDATTGRSIGAPLQGHTQAVITSVAFSPDGMKIVSGSNDHTLQLLDVRTGNMIGPALWGHTSGVNSVMFSPDGMQIVSGSYDSTIRLWDAKTGESIGAPLQGHTKAVTSVAFSPNGMQIVSCSDDLTVRLWDAKTGMSIGAPLEGHTGTVTSVAFSPDGMRIASGSEDHSVRLWDAKTGKNIGVPLGSHAQAVTCVAFSPDSMLIASSSKDDTVQLWDARTGEGFATPEGHTERINFVALSPDGTQIASCSADHTVRLWDAKTGASIGAPLEGHTHIVISVAFSSDSTQIASGSWDNTVRLWDARTGRSTSVPLEGHTKPVRSVAFSPDGKHIASGSWDGTVRLWDVRTAKVIIAPLEGHTDEVTSVTYSPDGLMIASGSYDCTIRLWDARTGRSIGAPLEGHTSVVSSVAFSPTGMQIASGSWDKTLRLWDTRMRCNIGVPQESHTEPIASVAFSPDGTQVATGSWDKTVRLWDTSTGNTIGVPLRGHTGFVNSVAFSPDGMQIVSASDDHTIRLWNVEGNSHNQTAQYPDHLFPQHTFTLRDGWLVTADGDLLLWIPPTYSLGLVHPKGAVNAIIGAHILELDFKNFKCGTEWAQCRRSELDLS